MKATRIIFAFFILFASHAKGQDTIVTKSINQLLFDNVKGTDLEREINSNSIQYELRLWICDFFFPDKLIQIKRDYENNWDYRLGYFQYDDTTRTIEFQDSIKKSIDWKQFEIKLDSFKIAKIPSQEEIDLILIKEGKTFKVKNEDFFSNILDGVAYTIEVYDNVTHKSIHYNNPHAYSAQLTRIGLPTKDHQDFIALVDYLSANFDLPKLRRIQMMERGQASKKSNKRARNRNKITKHHQAAQAL